MSKPKAEDYLLKHPHWSDESPCPECGHPIGQHHYFPGDPPHRCFVCDFNSNYESGWCWMGETYADEEKDYSEYESD